MIRTVGVLPAQTAADDAIELDYDHRHRRRIALTTEGGKRFLFDFEEATVLADGDVLELDDGSNVRIVAKPERVADIAAADPQALARIAWHLGNRHLPAEIRADRLRIRYDHVIVDMVRGLGAEVTILDAPFQPERGAYANGHRH